MIVYHGSFIEVNTPDIYHSRGNVDFGKGFYITSIREQAVNWAARFKRHKGKGIVSTYEFDIEKCKEDFQTLEFNRYEEEWLDFIISCRRSDNISSHDLVIGGVANDKVFNTIELYYDGLIDKLEAIKRLQYEKPNLQICIRNQEIIDTHVKFIKSEEI